MSKAEKIDGYKDGDQMKINKEILKKIILEEMKNLKESDQQAQAAPQQKATRSSIAKSRRSTTATQRGADATKLVGQEIPATGLIDEIEAILKTPGNSADPRVVTLLTRIRDHLQAKASKANTGGAQ